MPSTSAGVKYNMDTQQVAGRDVHQASLSAVTTSGTHGANPLWVLVGIAAVTIGLAGFSVSARVGKFAVAGKAGS